MSQTTSDPHTSSLPSATVTLLTVAELTALVQGVLEANFLDVRVTGEISNVARPTSGHIYFTLKDGQAQLRSVMWRGVARSLKFRLTDGLAVVVRGRLTVYPPRGEYQLVIEEVVPKGVGALELAYRQLKDELDGRGWFDPSRKRPLPRYPRRVALVTSPTGAAVRDMLRIMRRRWPLCEVWVCPVQVQGDRAAESIAAGLRLVNKATAPAADAVVVGRGGGSFKDLWPFNEEPVAAAIVESQVPVVSAVGHETDFTIADFVADVRAATPSEAAELVVPDRAEVLKVLADLRHRLVINISGRCERGRGKLDALAARQPFSDPLDRFRTFGRRLDELAGQATTSMNQWINRSKARVSAMAALLRAISPLRVLSRGYSLTHAVGTNTPVRDARQVMPGDFLETHLHHGTVFSRVESVRTDGVNPHD